MRRTLALATIGAALAAVALMRGAPAAAEIDLTGTWTFAITGEFGIFGEQTLYCTTELEQQGNDAAADFECGIASGNATGTLTPQPQGAIIDAVIELESNLVADLTADANGTVAPDGNSMEGTWTDRNSDADGTFSAERNTPRYLKGDINCDGAVNSVDALTEFLHLAGATVSQWPGCPGVEDQFASTFGDMNCDDTVSPADGLSILRYTGDLEQSPAVGCVAIGAMISAAP